MLLPRQRLKLARGAKDKEHAMSQTLKTAIAVVGIDIGKNSFHVVGLDRRGAMVLRQKWSRGQVDARFANMPPWLIGFVLGREGVGEPLAGRINVNILRCHLAEVLLAVASCRLRV